MVFELKVENIRDVVDAIEVQMYVDSYKANGPKSEEITTEYINRLPNSLCKSVYYEMGNAREKDEEITYEEALSRVVKEAEAAFDATLKKSGPVALNYARKLIDRFEELGKMGETPDYLKSKLDGSDKKLAVIGEYLAALKPVIEGSAYKMNEILNSKKLLYDIDKKLGEIPNMIDALGKKLDKTYKLKSKKQRTAGRVKSPHRH